LGCLESQSVLTNSYSTGDISGKTAVAGLVGVILTNSIMDGCYCTGDVKGNQSAGMAGSIHTSSSIINSWTTSEVRAISGKSTAGAVYSASGSTLENVYVLDENSQHSGIFVASYRSGGSGNIVIKNCHYSDYYDNYSVPVSNATKTNTENVNSYIGNIPFTYNNQSNIYTFCRSVKLQVGITSAEDSTINLDLGYVLKNLKKLRNIGLKSGNYINQCDVLLSELSARELEYGVIQNRLESVLVEISTKYDNLLATRSTIRDADIAEESSKYIQRQILQQASATLLATANQAPAIALQLI